MGVTVNRRAREVATILTWLYVNRIHKRTHDPPCVLYVTAHAVHAYTRTRHGLVSRALHDAHYSCGPSAVDAEAKRTTPTDFSKRIATSLIWNRRKYTVKKIIIKYPATEILYCLNFSDLSSLHTKFEIMPFKLFINLTLRYSPFWS